MIHVEYHASVYFSAFLTRMTTCLPPMACFWSVFHRTALHVRKSPLLAPTNPMYQCLPSTQIILRPMLLCIPPDPSGAAERDLDKRGVVSDWPKASVSSKLVGLRLSNSSKGQKRGLHRGGILLRRAPILHLLRDYQAKNAFDARRTTRDHVNRQMLRRI